MPLQILSTIGLAVGLLALWQQIQYWVRAKTNGGNSLVFGLLYSCMGLIAMMMPVEVSPGIIVHGAIVLICTGGLLYGWRVGLVALLFPILYRLYLGVSEGVTVGMFAGMINMLIPGVVACCFFPGAKVANAKRFMRVAAGVGLLSVVMTVAVSYLFYSVEKATHVLGLSLPVLMPTYILGPIILCNMVIRDEQRHQFLTTLENVIASVPIGVFVVAAPSRIGFANERGIAELTVPQFQRGMDLHLKDKALNESVSNLLAQGIEMGEATESRVETGDQRQIHVLIRRLQLPIVVPVWVIALQDLTKEIAIQQRAAVAQKMESLGTMAAGVAHEFNNLLTVVSNSLELTVLKEEAGERNRLASIGRKALNQASALTGQLLSFCRSSPEANKGCKIDEIVRESATLIQPLVGRGIHVCHELGAPGASVSLSSTTLQQILMNLVKNASDALVSADRRGEIVVATEKHSDYVILRVADDGPGMPSHVLPRIFEPFFTTKEVGKGTGLGLAMVFGSVREAGGHFEVESEVGKGTQFIIRLPVSNPDRESPQPSQATDAVAASPIVPRDAMLAVLD